MLTFALGDMTVTEICDIRSFDIPLAIIFPQSEPFLSPSGINSLVHKFWLRHQSDAYSHSSDSSNNSNQTVF